MNCWTFGIFLCGLLASFCLWNCLFGDVQKIEEDWYGCVDQKGKPTDFFFVYKLPQNKSSKNPLIKEGSAFMYITPESSRRPSRGGISSVLSRSDSSTSWLLSNISINKSISLAGRTLYDIYNNNNFKKTSTYFIYNDEFPNGTTSLSHGHTKGVLVINKMGGYWLIHSVPKYPPLPEDGYSYPKTAHRYGQSMLCISFPQISPGIVDSVARQIIENEPYLYSWNIPDEMKAKYPVLEEVVRPRRSRDATGPQDFRVAKFPSSLGKVFTSFAKSRKFGADLYSNLIAPVLKTNLYVESWRNGPQPLSSECNLTYKVENIQSIKAHSAYLSFTTHHDHSKWAVSQDSDKPYVCVGDINRMETQFIRAGGSVCISSLSIWHRFKDLIEETENCQL